MNAALIAKSNNRILQEIQRGCKSTAYKLIIPYTDGFENPNIINVMFKKVDGYYKGQDHVLEIKFQWGNPINHYYPFHPPLITFKTPIWHPNISGFPGGAVCLDFLKQEGLWDATCNIEGLVEMIKAMMDDPNPNSPQNPDAGVSYTESMKTKTWAKVCSNYYKQHILSCADLFSKFESPNNDNDDDDEPIKQPVKESSKEPREPREPQKQKETRESKKSSKSNKSDKSKKTKEVEPESSEESDENEFARKSSESSESTDESITSDESESSEEVVKKVTKKKPIKPIKSLSITLTNVKATSGFASVKSPTKTTKKESKTKKESRESQEPREPKKITFKKR